MQSKVLTFNITGEQARKLFAAAQSCGAEVSAISQADFEQPLGALLGALPRKNAVCLTPFGEKMLIMCGFSRAQMEQFLDILKKEQVTIPYKAMLTPTNLTWQCDALVRELVKEHAQIQQMRGQS
ncbi:MAG: DUF3783 domain-containing protein [Ruminococcaceae bacterium]|nr:DUF3783 domain-containing protein [Oscillospiraceae bacterium]